MSFNLATILTESALSHPDKTAVISGEHRLSYADLDAISDRFAVGLRAHDIRPGDAVGLQLPNLPQFVIAYFGLLKAGAIAVPMNVLYKADEIGYILGDAQARMLITWAGVAEEAAKGADQAGVSAMVVVSTPGAPEAREADASSSDVPRGLEDHSRPAAAGLPRPFHQPLTCGNVSGFAYRRLRGR